MTTKRARIEAEVLQRLAIWAAKADQGVDHAGWSERRRHDYASVRPSDVSRFDRHGQLWDEDPGFTTSEVTAALKRLEKQGWVAPNPYSNRQRDKDWVLTNPGQPPPSLPTKGHTHETLQCATCCGLITLSCNVHLERGHVEGCSDRPEVALKKTKIQCLTCEGEGQVNLNAGVVDRVKVGPRCAACRGSGLIWERYADRLTEREGRRDGFANF